MTAPRRALIVIDPQQEYFTGLLPIQYPPREDSIRKIATAIDAAEEAGVPVVMVQHSAGTGAPVFDPASEQFGLHPSLEAREKSGWKRVVKSLSSVFAGTDLATWLREQEIDTVTLVAYMTNRSTRPCSPSSTPTSPQSPSRMPGSVRSGAGRRWRRGNLVESAAAGPSA